MSKKIFNAIVPPFDTIQDDLADLDTKNHSDLDQLAWSVAGHTIDTDVDFNANDLLDGGTINGAKFIAANTLEQTITLMSLSHEVNAVGTGTPTPVDSNAYTLASFKLDYDFNNPIGFMAPTIKGMVFDFDLSSTAALGAFATVQPMDVTVDYAASVIGSGNPIKFAITSTNASTQFSSGAMLVDTKTHNATGTNISFRSIIDGRSSGSVYAYQGYGSGGNACTGDVIGVHGIAVQGAATSRLIGLRGQVTVPGNAPYERRTAVHATEAALICASGNLYVSTGPAATPNDLSVPPTNFPITSGSGNGFIQGDFEVDGTIYADGGALNSANGSTQDLTVTCGTGKTLVVDPGTWDDEKFPFIGVRLDSASTRYSYDIYNQSVQFDSNARYPNEILMVTFQSPHKIKGSSSISPHFHWLQQGSSMPNWLLAYKVVINGVAGAIETDFTNYTFLPWSANAYTYTSGVLNQITSFADISTSGWGISTLVYFAFFRDTTNASGQFAGADPSAIDELATDFDVHVLSDTLGSRTEFTK